MAASLSMVTGLPKEEIKCGVDVPTSLREAEGFLDERGYPAELRIINPPEPMCFMRKESLDYLNSDYIVIVDSEHDNIRWHTIVLSHGKVYDPGALYQDMNDLNRKLVGGIIEVEE